MDLNSVPEEEEEEYQDNTSEKVEQASVVKDLTQNLKDLQTWNDLLVKNGMQLQKAITDLESIEISNPDLAAKIKAVNEKTVIFRKTANTMIQVSVRIVVFSNLDRDEFIIIVEK